MVLTILLVDDDGGVLQFCTLVLQDIDGLRVLQAGGGTEALEIADRYRGGLDLLLSDILMRGMPSGFQIAETLTRRLPYLEVLLMSGCGFEEYMLNKRWHFIAKPFLPLQLVSKIEQALAVPLHRKDPIEALGT